MKRYTMLVIAVIILLSATVGTALDRVQAEKDQIVSRPAVTTAEEIYYGMKLSVPYNSTENHTTSFGATITDLDHRPIAISGTIYWHNANISSTKNDTAINNVWVKNAVIADVIQYLRQMNVSEVNANRSLIEDETRAALSGKGEFNVAIDNISLDNVSFLMIDDYKCYWENDASILLADSLKKDMAAASEKKTRNKIVIAVLIGIVIGIIIDEYRNRRS